MKDQKKRSGARSSSQHRNESDARGAAADYAKQNEEILFAVEAMRRAQLVQEQRVSHLLKQEPYYAVY